MARRPLPFREADVTRAVKGARRGGMSVGRFEIRPDGTIVIYAENNRSEPENPFDTWRAKRDASQA